MIPDSDVALVFLSSFSDNSAEELQNAFEEARAAGARRFVLDLRNNPGGRLDQAVQMAGYFLAPDSVVYIRKDASGEREEIKVEGDPESTGAPLAVLVDGGSASSAEILAGALRDNGRATVIGETTFGTGTVLSEFVLEGRLVHPARRRRVADPRRRLYPRDGDRARREGATGRTGPAPLTPDARPRSLQGAGPRQGRPTARGLRKLTGTVASFT